jgi:hypothetical protein
MEDNLLSRDCTHSAADAFEADGMADSGQKPKKAKQQSIFNFTVAIFFFKTV